MKIDLEWKGGERFSATDESGTAITLDGNRENAFSPMQTLLASLGACMAIDVVLILKKMRATLDGLTVALTGERTEKPPRYYRAIHMSFVVTGNVEKERVEHAVKLSLDRYCSVFHTLRADIDVTTSVLTQ